MRHKNLTLAYRYLIVTHKWIMGPLDLLNFITSIFLFIYFYFILFVYYLRQGAYSFAWVCLSVCLSVCLFVNKITQKLMDGF